MKQIEIDDEIYTHLLSNSKVIGESASDILRRLLGLPGYRSEAIMEKVSRVTLPVNKPRPLPRSGRKARKPRTKLSDLVTQGLLHQGQKLYLYLNEGEPQAEANVFGDHLLFKGEKRSMSDLALEFLRNESGYEYKAVRGPSQWFVGKEDGDLSISDLWNKYLADIGWQDD